MRLYGYASMSLNHPFPPGSRVLSSAKPFLLTHYLVPQHKYPFFLQILVKTAESSPWHISSVDVDMRPLWESGSDVKASGGMASPSCLQRPPDRTVPLSLSVTHPPPPLYLHPSESYFRRRKRPVDCPGRPAEDVTPIWPRDVLDAFENPQQSPGSCSVVVHHVALTSVLRRSVVKDRSSSRECSEDRKFEPCHDQPLVFAPSRSVAGSVHGRTPPVGGP